MELNFSLKYRTHVFFKDKMDEVKYLFDRDCLWIIDKKILQKFDVSRKKVFVFKGERSKDLDHVEACLEWLLENKADRNTSLVIAGGGATTDFGAFVGSVFNRGLKINLIPSTILGAVDSSIGGKTAVNFVAKNTVGTFYPAEKIVVVKELLSSLPEKLIASGKAEIIKVMMLTGSIDLMSGDMDLLSEKSLEQAIMDKYSIIADDLDDTLGKRVFLNWGHTFGHAIERFYGLSHGLAVANGMVLIQMYMEHLGINCMSHEELLQLFEKFGVNVNYENYLKDDGWQKFIKFDKKRDSEEILLVYLEKAGCPHIINRKLNDILKDLEEMR